MKIYYHIVGPVKRGAPRPRPASRRSASRSGSRTREKHWKFSATDLKEREHWAAYQDAFEQMLRTSTDWAPWWVIPADHRFVTRALPAGIVTQAINYLEVKPPVVSGEQARLIAQAKKELGVT